MSVPISGAPSAATEAAKDVVLQQQQEVKNGDQVNKKSLEGSEEIDLLSFKNIKSSTLTGQSIGKLPSVLSNMDAKMLEFLIFDALASIIKSKLDDFVDDMRDNIEGVRESLNLAKTQADEIRLQGGLQFGAAMASGAMSIAAGAVSIAGAGHSMKAAMSGGKFQLGKFQANQMRWQAISQATTSVGSMADGGFKFGATSREAEATRLRAESSTESALAQNARDSGKSSDEFLKQAMSMLKEILDSQHQARSKIIG